MIEGLNSVKQGADLSSSGPQYFADIMPRNGILWAFLGP